MRYIKTYEQKITRKVYWISTFGPKFEDSLVKLHLQYLGFKDMHEKIEIINSALELAADARDNNENKDSYVIIAMTYDINDYNEPDPKSINFEIWNLEHEKFLEDEGYIFIGYAPNTDKEKYEMFQNTKKYNI